MSILEHRWKWIFWELGLLCSGSSRINGFALVQIVLKNCVWTARMFSKNIQMTFGQWKTFGFVEKCTILETLDSSSAKFLAHSLYCVSLQLHFWSSWPARDWMTSRSMCDLLSNFCPIKLSQGGSEKSICFWRNAESRVSKKSSSFLVEWNRISRRSKDADRVNLSFWIRMIFPAAEPQPLWMEMKKSRNTRNNRIFNTRSSKHFTS